MKTIDTLKKHKTKVKNSLSLTRDICLGLAKDAGWHDKPIHPAVRIALIHSEVSEALEGIRKDIMDDHLPHRKMVEVELADALIRILEFCGEYDLDIGGAVVEKLIYNTNRSDHKPENRKKKGGKAF